MQQFMLPFPKITNFKTDLFKMSKNFYFYFHIQEYLFQKGRDWGVEKDQQ